LYFNPPTTKEKTNLPVYCRVKWHNLSIIDAALFAKLPYFDQPQSHLQHWFGKNKWEIIPHNIDSPLRPRSTEYYNQALKLSVIAIRGTYANSDWLQNIILWHESMVIEMLLTFIPFGRLLDSNAFSQLFGHFSLHWVLEFKPFYWSQVRSFTILVSCHLNQKMWSNTRRCLEL